MYVNERKKYGFQLQNLFIFCYFLNKNINSGYIIVLMGLL